LKLADILPAQPDTETKLIGIERLSFARLYGALQVRFHAVSSSAPVINLAPGDNVQLATLYEISENEPYIIEVALLGKAWLSPKKSMWRASSVSLPVAK
jgi:hypothetical protein